MDRGEPFRSWGRHAEARHCGTWKPTWLDEVSHFDDLEAPVLAVGLGRSYGDSCLNDGGYLIDATGLDHVLAFDPQTGVMRCAAGISLNSVLQVAIPRGWFLPVVPGTKFVTLGGALANDVHGKNHHCAGTFGCHVRQFELLRSNGHRIACSPQQNPEWFQATIGGLGLTGMVTWVELQLRRITSSNLDVKTTPFRGLNEFLELTRISEELRTEYTVAWIDCLSGRRVRGIFYSGNHATSNTLAPKSSTADARVPFAFPNIALNSLTVRAFNSIYYAMKGMHKGIEAVDYDQFFFPLDSVQEWNLIYGKRGLMQYQCVVPEHETTAFEDMLEEIARSGEGSFLGVIKRFGNVTSPGMMSFPRPGLTLALDFPYRGNRTLSLFEQLDAIVLEARGALYPAKDGRMSRMVFEASYPALEQFRAFVDPKMSSSFWRRMQEDR